MSISGTIKVVARVRPCFEKTMDFDGMQLDELNENGVRIEVPPGMKLGWLSNPLPLYQFGFNQIYWKNAGQEQIFNSVAKPMIDHAINGFNATLFAYGQTGSGKTFTLSGGDTYDERGIIPRAIAYTYQQLKKSHEFIFDVHVSYIEIFNSYAYDLLSNDREASERRLENLKKVMIHDSGEGIELHHETVGASSPLVPCQDFETALAQLFLGETNRQIAETTSNAVSSRSHCLFSLHILGRDVQNGTLRQSKIHFVDLAGSERMENLGDVKERMIEARFINLSLFHLHQVIDALKSKEEYIPYRQSKLTLILKDSLGGNCMTTMIAALSSKTAHIHETIETCKFAQNVMTIKNSAKANISMDPKVLIARLREEIVKLRHEIAVLRGEESEEPLGQKEKEDLERAITDFLAGKSDAPHINPSRFGFVLDLIKTRGLSYESTTKEQTNEKSSSIIGDPELKKAVAVLQKKLKRAESEIEVLVGMLNQKKNRSVAWTQTTVNSESEVTSGFLKTEQKIEDKSEVFKKFYHNHPKYRAIEANKKVMIEKISAAKNLTQTGYKIKEEIEALRRHIKERKESITDDELENDDLLNKMNKDVRDKVNIYMQVSSEIRIIKEEAETIDTMIQSCKKQVKRDFATFWEGQINQSGSSVPISMTNKIVLEEARSTGDPQADAAIEEFRKKREAFLKKASEVRNSNGRPLSQK